MKISNKRLAIDKANATVIAAVGIAVFIVIFSIVAGKALMDQRAYQSKVIAKKKTALKQLKKNLQEVEKLNNAYQEFAGATTNALGGNPKGNGPKDGENPRIVLDALPSKYDFPALTTSLEKMLKDNNYAIESIDGKDEEVAQAKQPGNVAPKPIEMPFTVAVTTSASATKSLLELFERSIRPMQIEKLTISGSNGDALKISIEAKTFYQPEKKFDVKVETIKRSENKKSNSKSKTKPTSSTGSNK